MPDISMCQDSECPSRVHCYRYRAKPSSRQSYAGFKHKGERCERYLPTSGWNDRGLLSIEEIERAEAMNQPATKSEEK